MAEAVLNLLNSEQTPRRVHLIGAAGAGMRSLANVLLQQGWVVSGSDERAVSNGQFSFESSDNSSLPRLSFRCFPGHAASHVPPHADLVVYSDAVPAENCERQTAVELGIETISYPAMLGRLMESGSGLAIAGTHGKSTTTAMVAEILIGANLDPTFVFGADWTNTGISGSTDSTSGGRAGTGSLLLVEACEYRENFLHLRPQIAAILNIEADHFDCFQDGAAVEQAFARFAAQLPASGKLIVNADSLAARQVAKTASAEITSFALEEAADWQAKNLAQSGGFFAFDLLHKNVHLGRVEMSLPGRHNVANALAAAAVCHAAGASVSSILAGIGRFRGLRRRLQRAGEFCGVAWIDDFAHHPSEISAALATIRQMSPHGRLWCVFQPHQASRTAALLDEFASSLQNTDCVFVTDIYRAREGLARPGEIQSADLAARIRDRGGNSPEVHSPAEIEELLASAISLQEFGPGDVLVTLGAGNVESIANGLLQRFREYCAAG